MALMDNDNLKCCPFCGSSSKRVCEYQGKYFPIYIETCLECNSTTYLWEEIQRSIMGTCKYCKTPVIWIKMQSGKVMPCNTGGLPYREKKDGNVKLVTSDGRVVTAELLPSEEGADGIGHISHYATCPGADKFRRR